MSRTRASVASFKCSATDLTLYASIMGTVPRQMFCHCVLVCWKSLDLQIYILQMQARCIGVLVLRSCPCPIRMWLESYVHLHSHLHDEFLHTKMSPRTCVEFPKRAAAI